MLAFGVGLFWFKGNMKIYTIHSESHNYLFDIMKDSLTVCRDYELISKTTKQVSKTGNYDADDIRNFWYLKVLYILEILHTETEPFLFSDVDMCFFRDFTQDLEVRLMFNDIVMQFEKMTFGLFPTGCAGFMYMKPNKKMKDAFIWVLKNLHKYPSDQQALNAYLYRSWVEVAFLPKTYYSINYDNNDKVWNGEDVNVTIKNPYLVHLHWTIGKENRLKLLNLVKKCLNTF